LGGRGLLSLLSGVGGGGPGLGGDDHHFVALDIEANNGGGGAGMVQAAAAPHWRSSVPEDVLVHSFSFLTPAELATVSSVSRAWSHASYEPSLWTHMDLSGLYLRVDDAFVIHLLGSGNRFAHLRFLSLEGCSAITNKTIRALMHYCPNLRELRLTECKHITNPWLFPELVKAMPYLRRIELLGVTREFAIVPAMQQARPKLDLGLFWLEYAAENGIKLDGSGLANCRYQEHGADEDEQGAAAAAPRAAAGAGQRGCWGRVKGRLVYSSSFYHRAGNWPVSVLYSCENHSAQDFADPEFQRCQVCENLFARPWSRSMWTNLICKVCFDKENLHNKRNWIALSDGPSAVRGFGLTELVGKTVHVASRKNLPASLRSYGTTPCNLDYNLPEPLAAEVDEEDAAAEQQPMIPRIGHVPLIQPPVPAAGAGLGLGLALPAGGRADGRRVSLGRGGRSSARIDPGEVPLATFVAGNGWRLDESIHRIRGQLKTAMEGLNTRALLVYDGSGQIEVLADKRVILDGREGEEAMDLTVQAWAVALEIIYPVLVVLILSLHFSVLFFKQNVWTWDGRTNYRAYIADPPAGGMGALVVILIALGVILAIAFGAFMVYRFREACERCFKRFLVADIAAILMFGAATLIWLLVTQWRIYLDTLTFCLLIWNAALTGLMTLYFPMPERLHHFFLVLLNAVMAILLVATLPIWILITFLFVAALGDVLSELRPQARLLSPFIIPANVELIYNTPKILYTVGGLRLRAADLLWYGLLAGLVMYTSSSSREYAAVLLGGTLVVVCVLSSLALLLFVLPFVGCRARPLPLAIVTAFVLTMIQSPVIEPFLLAAHNNIWSDPLDFA